MDGFSGFRFLFGEVGRVHIAFGAILQSKEIGDLCAQLDFELLNNMNQHIPKYAVEFIQTIDVFQRNAIKVFFFKVCSWAVPCFSVPARFCSLAVSLKSLSVYYRSKLFSSSWLFVIII